MLKRLGVVVLFEERSAIMSTRKTLRSVTIGVERRAMVRVFESEGAKDLRLYNERKLDNRGIVFETGFESMGLIAMKESSG